MWCTPCGFHQYIFKKRRLRLPWPLDVRFCNLSKLRVDELARLLEYLQDGALYFYKVSDWEDYAFANDIEGVAPGRFDNLGSLHSGRSDVKKSRFDRATGRPISSRRRLRLAGTKTPKYL